MKSARKLARKARPKRTLSRWKRWGLVLTTLLAALQLVQKVGEIAPTAARLIAAATDDGPPVTDVQIESLRTKAQW